MIFVPFSAPATEVSLAPVAQGRQYALPLNNPGFVPNSEAKNMQDEDLVVGVSIAGDHRAYPWWAMVSYHVVNDTFQRTPVLITLCEICSGSSAFIARHPRDSNRTLSFQACGMGKGTFVLCDHETRSLWHPFLGEAESGEFKGMALERIPTLMMKWKDWKQRFPNGKVLLVADSLRKRKHGRSQRPGNAYLPKRFNEFSNLKDDRLPKNELVVGIRPIGEEKALAIPFRLFSTQTDKIQLKRGKRNLTVERTSAFSAVVYNNSKIESSYVTEWYEWVSSFPDSEIYKK